MASQQKDEEKKQMDIDKEEEDEDQVEEEEKPQDILLKAAELSNKYTLLRKSMTINNK